MSYLAKDAPEGAADEQEARIELARQLLTFANPVVRLTLDPPDGRQVAIYLRQQCAMHEMAPPPWLRGWYTERIPA